MEHLDKFVEFLVSSDFESGESLKVTYTDRRSKKRKSFNNLYDAFIGYRWNEHGYEDTKNQLDDLSTKLRTSFLENRVSDFVAASMGVLEWGRVKSVHNVNRLNQAEFFPFVKAVDEILKKALDLETTTAMVKKVSPIFSNAGFTKIYSLLFDNWIIYDSRVATSLQFLVLLYLKKNNISEIPESLHFATPLSRGDKSGNYRIIPRFKKILQNPWHHLGSNLKANYVLTQYLERNSNTKFKGVDKLRQLEAALFVIGYDLGESEIVTDSKMTN